MLRRRVSSVEPSVPRASLTSVVTSRILHADSLLYGMRQMTTNPLTYPDQTGASEPPPTGGAGASSLATIDSDGDERPAIRDLMWNRRPVANPTSS